MNGKYTGISDAHKVIGGRDTLPVHRHRRQQHSLYTRQLQQELLELEEEERAYLNALNSGSGHKNKNETGKSLNSNTDKQDETIMGSEDDDDDVHDGDATTRKMRQQKHKVTAVISDLMKSSSSSSSSSSTHHVSSGSISATSSTAAGTSRQRQRQQQHQRSRRLLPPLLGAVTAGKLAALRGESKAEGARIELMANNPSVCPAEWGREGLMSAASNGVAKGTSAITSSASSSSHPPIRAEYCEHRLLVALLEGLEGLSPAAFAATATSAAAEEESESVVDARLKQLSVETTVPVTLCQDLLRGLQWEYSAYDDNNTTATSDSDDDDDDGMEKEGNGGEKEDGKTTKNGASVSGGGSGGSLLPLMNSSSAAATATSLLNNDDDSDDDGADEEEADLALEAFEQSTAQLNTLRERQSKARKKERSWAGYQHRKRLGLLHKALVRAEGYLNAIVSHGGTWSAEASSGFSRNSHSLAIDSNNSLGSVYNNTSSTVFPFPLPLPDPATIGSTRPATMRLPLSLICVALSAALYHETLPVFQKRRARSLKDRKAREAAEKSFRQSLALVKNVKNKSEQKKNKQQKQKQNQQRHHQNSNYNNSNNDNLAATFGSSSYFSSSVGVIDEMDLQDLEEGAVGGDEEEEDDDDNVFGFLSSSNIKSSSNSGNHLPDFIPWTKEDQSVLDLLCEAVEKMTRLIVGGPDASYDATKDGEADIGNGSRKNKSLVNMHQQLSQSAARRQWSLTRRAFAQLDVLSCRGVPADLLAAVLPAVAEQIDGLLGHQGHGRRSGTPRLVPLSVLGAVLYPMLNTGHKWDDEEDSNNFLIVGHNNKKVVAAVQQHQQVAEVNSLNNITNADGKYISKEKQKMAVFSQVVQSYNDAVGRYNNYTNNRRSTAQQQQQPPSGSVNGSVSVGNNPNPDHPNNPNPNPNPNANIRNLNQSFFHTSAMTTAASASSKGGESSLLSFTSASVEGGGGTRPATITNQGSTTRPENSSSSSNDEMMTMVTKTKEMMITNPILLANPVDLVQDILEIGIGSNNNNTDDLSDSSSSNGGSCSSGSGGSTALQSLILEEQALLMRERAIVRHRMLRALKRKKELARDMGVSVMNLNLANANDESSSSGSYDTSFTKSTYMAVDLALGGLEMDEDENGDENENDGNEKNDDDDDPGDQQQQQKLPVNHSTSSVSSASAISATTTSTASLLVANLDLDELNQTNRENHKHSLSLQTNGGKYFYQEETERRLIAECIRQRLLLLNNINTNNSSSSGRDGKGRRGLMNILSSESSFLSPKHLSHLLLHYDPTMFANIAGRIDDNLDFLDDDDVEVVEGEGEEDEKEKRDVDVAAAEGARKQPSSISSSQYSSSSPFSNSHNHFGPGELDRLTVAHLPQWAREARSADLAQIQQRREECWSALSSAYVGDVFGPVSSGGGAGFVKEHLVPPAPRLEDRSFIPLYCDRANRALEGVVGGGGYTEHGSPAAFNAQQHAPPTSTAHTAAVEEQPQFTNRIPDAGGIQPSFFDMFRRYDVAFAASVTGESESEKQAETAAAAINANNYCGRGGGGRDTDEKTNDVPSSSFTRRALEEAHDAEVASMEQCRKRLFPFPSLSLLAQALLRSPSGGPFNAVVDPNIHNVGGGSSNSNRNRNNINQQSGTTLTVATEASGEKDDEDQIIRKDPATATDTDTAAIAGGTHHIAGTGKGEGEGGNVKTEGEGPHDEQNETKRVVAAAAKAGTGAGAAAAIAGQNPEDQYDQKLFMALLCNVLGIGDGGVGDYDETREEEDVENEDEDDEDIDSIGMSGEEGIDGDDTEAGGPRGSTEKKKKNYYGKHRNWIDSIFEDKDNKDNRRRMRKGTGQGGKMEQRGRSNSSSGSSRSGSKARIRRSSVSVSNAEKLQKKQQQKQFEKKENQEKKKMNTAKRKKNNVYRRLGVALSLCPRGCLQRLVAQGGSALCVSPEDGHVIAHLRKKGKDGVIGGLVEGLVHCTPFAEDYGESLLTALDTHQRLTVGHGLSYLKRLQVARHKTKEIRRRRRKEKENDEKRQQKGKGKDRRQEDDKKGRKQKVKQQQQGSSNSSSSSSSINSSVATKAGRNSSNKSSDNTNSATRATDELIITITNTDETEDKTEETATETEAEAGIDTDKAESVKYEEQAQVGQGQGRGNDREEDGKKKDEEDDTYLIEHRAVVQGLQRRFRGLLRHAYRHVLSLLWDWVCELLPMEAKALFFLDWLPPFHLHSHESESNITGSRSGRSIRRRMKEPQNNIATNRRNSRNNSDYDNDNQDISKSTAAADEGQERTIRGARSRSRPQTATTSVTGLVSSRSPSSSSEAPRRRPQTATTSAGAALRQQQPSSNPKKLPELQATAVGGQGYWTSDDGDEALLVCYTHRYVDMDMDDGSRSATATTNATAAVRGGGGGVRSSGEARGDGETSGYDDDEDSCGGRLRDVLNKGLMRGISEHEKLRYLIYGSSSSSRLSTSPAATSPSSSNNRRGEGKGKGVGDHKNTGIVGNKHKMETDYTAPSNKIVDVENDDDDDLLLRDLVAEDRRAGDGGGDVDVDVGDDNDDTDELDDDMIDAAFSQRNHHHHHHHRHQQHHTQHQRTHLPHGVHPTIGIDGEAAGAGATATSVAVRGGGAPLGFGRGDWGGASRGGQYGGVHSSWAHTPGQGTVGSGIGMGGIGVGGKGGGSAGLGLPQPPPRSAATLRPTRPATATATTTILNPNLNRNPKTYSSASSSSAAAPASNEEDQIIPVVVPTAVVPSTAYDDDAGAGGYDPSYYDESKSYAYNKYCRRRQDRLRPATAVPATVTTNTNATAAAAAAGHKMVAITTEIEENEMKTIGTNEQGGLSAELHKQKKNVGINGYSTTYTSTSYRGDRSPVRSRASGRQSSLHSMSYAVTRPIIVSTSSSSGGGRRNDNEATGTGGVGFYATQTFHKPGLSSTTNNPPITPDYNCAAASSTSDDATTTNTAANNIAAPVAVTMVDDYTGGTTGHYYDISHHHHHHRIIKGRSSSGGVGDSDGTGSRTKKRPLTAATAAAAASSSRLQFSAVPGSAATDTTAAPSYHYHSFASSPPSSSSTPPLRAASALGRGNSRDSYYATTAAVVVRHPHPTPPNHHQYKYVHVPEVAAISAHDRPSSASGLSSSLLLPTHPQPPSNPSHSTAVLQAVLRRRAQLQQRK